MRCVATALLSCLLSSVGCSGPSLEVLARRSPDFLVRQGQRLFWQAQPYRYLGFNAFSLTGCGSAMEVPTDEQIDQFFASLRPRSLVRTYAFEPFGLGPVERTVAAAKKHGHLLTLVLTDGNGTCGDSGSVKTPAWYETDFRTQFLPWVGTIVARFKDEPTVGMWEVVNMPTDVAALTLRNFYDVVGGQIHALDANHLVESGTHGSWAYGGEEAYSFIHQSPGIDVVGFHDFDNGAAEPPNLAVSLRVGAALGKPVVLDEMGMFASESGDPGTTLNDMPCISWASRRESFRRQLTAAFATELAGIDVWNWVPATPHVCSYYAVPGDPLVELIHDFPLP